ncbi:hypothetical protein [Prevotella communis]|uniref:hypothetical protein n=1 Tax=Prevotella communis TaxID=2913614 RepID=UPI001EDAEB5A|nr:hypothetical protein [Prevotella communis]UKK56704.1 hypothetical protein L6476_00160 [Prevotella communis]
MNNCLYVNSNTATITTSEGVITKLVIKKFDGTYGDNFTEANVGVTPGTITYGSDEIIVTDINAESVTLSRKGGDNWSTSSVDVYYASPSGPKVAWDKAKKTGTFTMPGGNVTLEPEYYDLATLADNGLTAAVDAAAKTEAPLAVLAENAVTGGTLMYFVIYDENFSQADAIALAEDEWEAAIPTAETIEAAGTYYVWYYIKGDDEHSDTDPQRLAVTVLPEPTYAVEFAEGTEESDKWSAIPNTGVKKGQQVTVNYSGSKKIIGVKAEKKAAPAEEPVTLATPLTIEAITAGTIRVKIDGPLETGMKYSVNGGTKTTITSTTSIEGLKAGDKVQFYGNGTQTQVYGGDTEVSIQGSGDGFQTKAYGNIMSLLDEEGFATKTDLPNTKYVFYGLFKENSTLIDASEMLLPATTLTEACYPQMFNGCTSLTTAPKLPATTLTISCYYCMFSRCTSLTSAYVKAAYIEDDDECGSIFGDCTATGAVLHTAPGSKASWENVMGTDKYWENWSVADDWEE